MSIHQTTGHLIHWLNRESPPSATPLCDFERFRHELKPCDVILVEGRSRVSGVIRLITASPWTHAALYIGRIHDIEDEALRESLERYCNFPPNEQLIIESVLGKGTIVNTLSFYTHDHIRICRPAGLSYKDAQQVVRYAISRLGAEYDVRQIFDLARFLFPWFLLPRRWRSSLFRSSAGDSTRTVCSTMIAEAFGFIQFPILPLVKKVGQSGVQLFRRNPKICVPSDFDYSPHFEIIKYPFIDLGLHKDYRLLPWKGSGQLSREEAEFYFEDQDEPITTPEPDNETVHSNVTPITKQGDCAQKPAQTIDETAPTPHKETVSPLKRVANRIEDALPRGWLDSNNAPEQPSDKDEITETSPQPDPVDAQAEQSQNQAQNEEDYDDQTTQSEGNEPPITPTETPASASASTTDTVCAASTDHAEQAEQATKNTEDQADNGTDYNLTSQEAESETKDMKTENEASVVEKWLRNITSSKPKSDD